MIQSIVNRDEDNERASSLGSSDLQNEANDEVRPGSPTINGEDELGGEDDSEARPLIRHRPRPITGDGTSSEQQAESAEDFSTSLDCSEAQKMQKLVKKLRLQVGPISAFPIERWASSVQQVFLGAGLGFLTALLALVPSFPRPGLPLIFWSYSGTLLITAYVETLADRWSKAEEIWEASWSVIAYVTLLE